MISTFEKIPKLIPLLSLWILFSSIIKNQLYYDNFGININEFINLSEFPILFISDFTSYFFYLLYFITFLGVVYVKAYYRKLYGHYSLPFSTVKKVGLLAIIFIPLIILFQLFFFNMNLYLKLQLIQTEIILFLVGILLYLDKDIKFSKKYYIVSCSILLLILSSFKANIDILKIEEGKTSYKIQFISNTLHYQSTSDYLFIGKTHDYIFMYDKKNRLTEVFKTAEINGLKLQKL